MVPGGSRYLIIKELGLEDHDYYGFWGLNSEQYGTWNLWGMCLVLQ